MGTVAADRVIRLDRVRLRDWRSWRGEHVLEVGALTRISGPNGSGKSGVLDAIRWALTGVCRGTDAGGRGAAALVADGADVAVVVLECTAGGRPWVVTRTTGKTSTLRVEGAAAVSGKAAEAALEAVLGVGPTTTGVVLDAPTLLSSDHACAKKVLLDALAVRVRVDDLAWPTGAPDRSGPAVGLDELDALYKWAYDARRDARARLATIPEPGAEVVEHDGGAIPDPADLAAQVAALEAQHHDAVRASGAADAERADQLRAHARATADHAAAEKLIRGYATTLGVRADDGVDVYARRAAEKVDTLTAQIETLRARQTDLVDRVNGALAAKVTAEAKLAAADASPVARAHDPSAGCVLSGDIPCKTSRKAFEAFVAVQQKAHAALTAETAAARDAYDGLAVAARGNATVLSESESALRVAQRAQQEVVAAVSRLHAASAAMLPPEAVAALEAPVVPGEVALLWARVVRGRELVERAKRLHGAARERARLVDARTSAAAAADACERLAAALGPHGRRVAALQDAIASWQAHVNAALPHGLQVSFSLDPWGVWVNGRPAVLLSESERLRVGLALGVALASTVRLRLVLLDAFDLFDERTRAGAAVALKGATDAGLQVVVCVTRDTMPPASSPGMVSHWLGAQA